MNLVGLRFVPQIVGVTTGHYVLKVSLHSGVLKGGESFFDAERLTFAKKLQQKD